MFSEEAIGAADEHAVAGCGGERAGAADRAGDGVVPADESMMTPDALLMAMGGR